MRTRSCSRQSIVYISLTCLAISLSLSLLRCVFKDYFSQHSNLPQHENRFLGLMSAWKPVFMVAIWSFFHRDIYVDLFDRKMSIVLQRNLKPTHTCPDLWVFVVLIGCKSAFSYTQHVSVSVIVFVKFRTATWKYSTNFIPESVFIYGSDISHVGGHFQHIALVPKKIWLDWKSWLIN